MVDLILLQSIEPISYTDGVRLKVSLPVLIEQCDCPAYKPVFAVSQGNRTQQCPEDGIPVILQQLPDIVDEKYDGKAQQLSTGCAYKLQVGPLKIIFGSLVIVVPFEASTLRPPIWGAILLHFQIPHDTEGLIAKALQSA